MNKTSLEEYNNALKEEGDGVNAIAAELMQLKAELEELAAMKFNQGQ